MTIATADTIALESPGAWTRAERDAWRPRQRMLVSEWAAQHRRVFKGPREGLWRHETAPFGVAIMDAYCEPGTETIVVIGPAQASKTECAIINPLLFKVGHVGEDCLLMLPSQDLAESMWRERIEPAIHADDDLAALVPPPKLAGRRGERFFLNGATLALVGAESIAKLASRPFPNIFCDEVDKYPLTLGEEADPVSLAINRTKAFPGRRKIGIVCTVTVELGEVWQRYLPGSREHYFAPCPHCGKRWVFRYDWSEASPFQYDATEGLAGAGETARIACPHCTGSISDAERRRALLKGEWRSTAKAEQAGHDPGCRSFWYCALQSPLQRLDKLAIEMAKARGNDTKMKDVQQSSMTLPWEEPGSERYDKRFILSHRLQYEAGTVPDGVELITGSVDVQKRWLIAHFRGWAHTTPLPTSWLIEWRYITRVHGDSVGQALDEVADNAADGWTKANGETIQPALAFVDSGAFTEDVYAWVRRQNQRQWRAYKGTDRGEPYNRTDKRKQHGVWLWVCNSSEWKLKVYELLRVDRGEPGYFGLHGTTETEYAKHLTAEEWRPVTVEKGRTVPAHWHRLRRANHLLDCEAMTCCAAALCGMFGPVVTPRQVAIADDGGSELSEYRKLVDETLQELGR